MPVNTNENEMECMRQMPMYQCHKKVWALKIGERIMILENGDAILPIVDSGFAPIRVDKAVISRYIPLPGDYYVQYADGYKSISPAKVFEDGYTLIS